MRLLGTSFFFCAVTLAAACSSPDVKLGNGDETSTTGGAGGTSGSGGSGGSGASTSLCSGTVVGTGNCTALDSLKNEATDLCSAANLELSDIVYDGDCNPGEAAFAKVTCCGDVPEPPPPPESCLYEVTGDPSMCQDNATLKVQASDICLSKGYQLVDVVYDDTCGPESSYFAKYVCCQGDEPPPPPEVCFGTLLGDPAACTDNKELSTQAYYLCAASNAVLTNLELSDACSPEASHYAKVECCVPTPPPPNQCFGDFVGDPAVCSDNSNLEEQAGALCESKGGKLQSFEGDGACGPASSYLAKFECCAADEPPPPPTEVCTEESIATPGCTNNETLATMAKDACAENNTVLEGLAFDESCGPNGSTSAKFVCCAESPPPPPATCFGTSIDTPGCTDNDALKEIANGECSSVGGELISMTYDDACGPQGSKSAQYACCTPDPAK